MTMDQDVFNTDRPLLFSIAYRMLGSASDAEDVLQDAWLRYRGADAATIRSPKAFATTIVTRLCLDRLKSARATREEYVGPWLPEPVLTSELDPADRAQRAESVTLAFLVLLETLSPEERAVFLLKEIFEYDHAEIAGMLDTTAANSRQLLHRAKARLAEGRPPRLSGTADSRRAVAERFARAFASGDATELTALLTADVGMWSDGGRKALAARRPLLGRDEVLNFLVGLHRTAQNAGIVRDMSLVIEEVNSEPALAVRNRGRLDSVFVFSIENGTIAGIRVVRNPDKLAHIGQRLTTLH